MVPNLSRVAVLVHPASTSRDDYFTSIRALARQKKIAVLLLEAQTREEVERAFARAAEEHAGGMIVVNDAFFFG